MKHTAPLAQLAEQKSSKLPVAGSSPARGTIFAAALLACGLAFIAPAEAAKSKTANAVPHKAVKSSAAKAKLAPALKAKAPALAKQSKRNSKSSKAVAPSKVLAAPEAPVREVVLEKGPTPARTQLGCSTESAGLSAVGQTHKAEGKTFRCQKTWDYVDGKFVGYPAWVELFMPTPGWGAGLRETSPPPADAVVPVVPGAAAKVAPLATVQPEAETKPEPKPPSFGSEIY